MPERKRIVRFEIVFSCIPFLLRLSQIVEPEPEPHPRPPRKALEIGLRFSVFIQSAVPRGQTQDFEIESKGNSIDKPKFLSCQSFTEFFFKSTVFCTSLFVELPVEPKPCFSLTLPFRATFEILHLSGVFRLVKRSKTAKRLFENLSQRAGVWIR